MSRVRGGVNTQPTLRAVRTTKRRAAAAMAAIDAGSKISTTVFTATDFVRSLIEIRLFEAVSFECAFAETVLVQVGLVELDDLEHTAAKYTV